MNEFVQRHASKVIGMLSGFDRILFRGTLRRLANAGGLKGWLWAKRVLLKDFGVWSQELTERVRQASESVVREAGRPMRYLNDSSLSKEALARAIAARDGIRSGLVCQFSAVEPCWSYDIHRNRTEKKLQLVARQRKCLHLYHYFVHEQAGFGHVRLQTWLPFNVKVCLNGREWLSRQMDAAGVGYVKRDNCFTWVSDVDKAQALLQEQLKTGWPALLESIRELLFPSYRSLLGEESPEYYWSMDQSEWASDVMFKRASELSSLYPKLIVQGMRTLGSRQVMRFLGHKVPTTHGGVNGNFEGEVVSDLDERVEGMRLKHRVNHNSVKMYDKQGSVLRVETTINNPREFKVYRKVESDPRSKPAWRKLRKGVADVHRRAKVSQACNERYLASLAATECDATVEQVLSPLSRAVNQSGRRHRGLRVLEEQDGALLQAVGRGEWSINGFTNAGLRRVLLGEDDGADVNERRRRSGRISRKLALLRAHGLIRRVPHTKRWMLTNAGRRVTTLLSVAKSESARKLMQQAA